MPAISPITCMQILIVPASQQAALYTCSMHAWMPWLHVFSPETCYAGHSVSMSGGHHGAGQAELTCWGQCWVAQNYRSLRSLCGAPQLLYPEASHDNPMHGENWHCFKALQLDIAHANAMSPRVRIMCEEYFTLELRHLIAQLIEKGTFNSRV